MRTNDPSLEPGAWIRRFHPAPDAATRLVCFPHAGGSATFYFPVSRALSPRVDVLAVQYPGRFDRRHEPCVEDIHRLADLVARELEPWFDRPVTFFGHSLGATLGFEVVRRLESGGTGPVRLFASGRRAPSRHRVEAVHRYGDAELVAQLQRMSGTDSKVFDDDELVRMILPVIRSDYKAAETYRYRPGPTLTCSISVLIGDEDSEVTLDEARAWESHTTGEFELKVFPGGHFYLNEHAGAVLAEITAHVEALTLD